MVILCVALGMAVLFLGSISLQYRKEKKQKELISFCMSHDINVWVGNAQVNLKCDDKYLVEYQNCDLWFILNEFQFSLSRRYFKDASGFRIVKSDFQNQQMFLCRELWAFLEKNERSSFKGKDMYASGTDGNRVLSDFGLTYYRTYHTAMLFCNPYTKPSYLFQIEKLIDEKLENDARSSPAKCPKKRKPYTKKKNEGTNEEQHDIDKK